MLLFTASTGVQRQLQYLWFGELLSPTEDFRRQWVKKRNRPGIKYCYVKQKWQCYKQSLVLTEAPNTTKTWVESFPVFSKVCFMSDSGSVLWDMSVLVAVTLQSESRNRNARFRVLNLDFDTTVYNRNLGERKQTDISQPIAPSIHPSINPSLHSINQSTNQPINRSNKQSIN